MLDKINNFVKAHLPTEVEKVYNSKFIHDPLWGTIELFDYELSIIDTPLFQRLRFIHQTGFVFETYPSAHHTRLEHTMGAVHIADRIITHLKLRYPERLKDNEILFRVRLAALFHDIGHSAYSHSSEEVYQDYDDIKSLISESEKFKNKGAGEVLSNLILTSESFSQYYSKLQKVYAKIADIKIDDFADYILGKAPDDKLFEANVISGPFDADKLDYFPRDGRASGIEISLDIERLIHCLEIADVKKEDESERTVTTIVMNRGGFNAAQQLLFARASLFATVYHHHKVRACDCMFKSCINYLRENNLSVTSANSNKNFIKFESASDFLYINDYDFYSVMNCIDNDEHILMFRQLFNRNLFKRILTISSYTIHDFQNSDQQKANLAAFLNYRKDTSKLKLLKDEILNHAQLNELRNNVWIDIPKKPSFEKAGQALINMSSRKMPVKTERLSNVIPIMDWVDTYEKFYAQSYLFGPNDKKQRINLAISALSTLKTFRPDKNISGLDLILNSNSVAEDIRQDVHAALGDNLPN